MSKSPGNVGKATSKFDTRHRRIQANLFDELSKAIEENGISVRLLCKEAGVCRHTYLRWQNGALHIRLTDFIALCEVIKLDPSVVLAKAISQAGRV